MVSISLLGPILFVPMFYLMHITICTEYAVQSIVCTRSTIDSLWMAVIYFFFGISLLLNYKLIRSVDGSLLSSIGSLQSNKIVAFLIVGMVCHAISTTSSSFIEEEHQIWYYFNCTLLVWLWWLDMRALWLKQQEQQSNEPSFRLTDLLNWSQIQWLLIFAGHLIARRLNQTGDKWLNVPDIGDWLCMAEHKLANSLFMVGALIAMHLATIKFGNILTNVLTLTASVLIYYYRTLTGSVIFVGIQPSQ